MHLPCDFQHVFKMFSHLLNNLLLSPHFSMLYSHQEYFQMIFAFIFSSSTLSLLSSLHKGVTTCKSIHMKHIKEPIPQISSSYAQSTSKNPHYQDHFLLRFQVLKVLSNFLSTTWVLPPLCSIDCSTSSTFSVADNQWPFPVIELPFFYTMSAVDLRATLAIVYPAINIAVSFDE